MQLLQVSSVSVTMFLSETWLDESSCDAYLYHKIQTLTLSNTTSTVNGIKGVANPVTAHGGP
jgi:hypothetical protein